MARRIVEAGFPLTLWARRSHSTEPYADTAATIAARPDLLGAASDVVGICVVGDADVEEVLLGERGVLAGMTRGGIVAIHSTVHPDTCRRLATAAAGLGIAVIDAPVSGGGQAAANRSLLVMVGGEPEAVAVCRPVLEAFGDPVVYLGPLGSGQTAKLINNFVFTAQLSLAVETYAFADELGVDRTALGAVLAHGSGGSRVAAIVSASGMDLAGIRAAAPLLRKDVDLVLDLARQRATTGPALLLEAAARSLVLLEQEVPTDQPTGAAPAEGDGPVSVSRRR